MDAQVARLVVILDALVPILERSSEPRWAAWLARDAARIRNGDGGGVTHLLRAFGGMGSLSDVVLADPVLDGRLRSLRADAYELAVALSPDREA